MNTHYQLLEKRFKSLRLLAGLVIVLLLGSLLAACSDNLAPQSWAATEQPGSNWVVQGTVNSITNDGWIVDGHKILSSSNVVITGVVTPGVEAIFSGRTDDAKNLIALQIVVTVASTTTGATATTGTTSTTGTTATTKSDDDDTATATTTPPVTGTTTAEPTTETATSTTGTVSTTTGGATTPQVGTEPIEVEGMIEALSGNSITIGGRTFTFEAAVVVQNGHQLYVGGRAHVSARVVDGKVVVIKVIAQGGVNKGPTTGAPQTTSAPSGGDNNGNGNGKAKTDKGKDSPADHDNGKGNDNKGGKPKGNK